MIQPPADAPPDEEELCRCAPTHRGASVDRAALRHPAVPADPRAPFPFLIVPGYTPRWGWRSGLHPKAEVRLQRALTDLQTGLAPAVIVSGGAVHSADNEAILMRDWLLERGVSPNRIIVEPCARHTTTNLRNAGRVLLAHGASEALVVTSDGFWAPRLGSLPFVEQSYYLGYPWISSFHLRCMIELGYRVGELAWLAPMHIRFRPSQSVLRSSRSARDP